MITTCIQSKKFMYMIPIAKIVQFIKAIQSYKKQLVSFSKLSLT